MSEHTNGLVYTFYSYKGGVGRSMALANVATYFFQRRGIDVLMVDWDLEAPGLERYFQERYGLQFDAMTEKPGLADLIQRYKSNLSNPPDNSEASPYPPLEDYLTVLEDKDDSRLMLISAGQRGTPENWKQYAKFIQSFDWVDFYANWAGGGFMDWLRDELCQRADVILIDSRTGVTEMGGVATQHMADVVVMLFASNSENMENTARMANNFLSTEATQRRSGQPLSVITVPSRVDDSDSQSYSAFLNRLRELFSGFQRQEFGRTPLQDMLLPYLPLFSHREAILFGNPEHEGAGQRLVSGYVAVASNMIALAPETHPIRAGKRKVSRRGQVFVSYSAESFNLAEELRQRLLERGINVQANFAPETWTSENYEEDERQIEQSACLIVLIDEKTSASKLVRQYINLAQDIKVPIIPLMAAPGPTKLPLQLRSIQSLDWSNQSGSRAWEQLFSSVDHYLNISTSQSVAPTPTKSTVAKRKVYISYSRRDSHSIARRLTRDLSSEDFDVFIDDLMITPGQDWADALERSLTAADIILVLLSSSYLESQFVQSEIAFAQQLDKLIIPLLVEKVHIPLRLIRSQYIDFTENYQKGLDALVRHLTQAALTAEVEQRPQHVKLDDAVVKKYQGELRRYLADLPGQDRSIRLGQALQTFSEVLTLQRDVPLDYATTQTIRADLLRDLATLTGEDRRGRLMEALKAYDDVLAVFHTAGDVNGQAATLTNIGSVWSDLGEVHKALDYYNQALLMLRESGDRRSEAITLNNMAIVYSETGQPGKALELFEQALPIRQAEGDRAGEAAILNNMAEVYAGTSQPSKALELFEQTLPIIRTIGDRAGEAVTLNNMAEVYRETGQPSKALELFEQALPIMRALDDRAGEAAILNNIAIVYTGTGQPSKALELFEQALPVMRAMNDREGEAFTLNNMGRMYSETGQPSKALELFEQALPIMRTLSDRRGESLSLINLGVAYTDLGQYEQAIDYLHRALAISREIGDQYTVGGVLFNLGNIYTDLGQYEQAIDYLQNARNIFSARDVPHLLAQVDGLTARVQAARAKGGEEG